jgi:Holliday junction resolvasome RuvABC endonuclease subunit
VVSGVRVFEGDLDSRLGEYHRWLCERMPEDTVVMERPQGLQGWALESQLGMIGITRALCDLNEVQFIPVSPMTSKKAATGSGKAKKSDMVDWAKQAYGRDNMSHDEADALALLCYWRGVH